MDTTQIEPREAAITGSIVGESVAQTLVLQPDRLTRDQIELIKRTVAIGATDDELRLFLYMAEKYQLDPFRHEIWCIKYKSKDPNKDDPAASIITGRDGYLKIAMRDPGYMGIQSFVVKDGDEFQIDADSGQVVHRFAVTAARKTAEILGAWARAYHKDREPMVGFVDMQEYRGKSPIWQDYPSAMIQKVAEVFVLRRQYNITGMVSAEELDVDLYAAAVAKPVGPALPPAARTRQGAMQCAACQGEIKTLTINTSNGPKTYTAAGTAAVSMRDFKEKLCLRCYTEARKQQKAAGNAPQITTIEGKVVTPPESAPVAPPAPMAAPSDKPKPNPLTDKYTIMSELWGEVTDLGGTPDALIFPTDESDVDFRIAKLRGQRDQLMAEQTADQAGENGWESLVAPPADDSPPPQEELPFV